MQSGPRSELMTQVLVEPLAFLASMALISSISLMALMEHSCWLQTEILKGTSE
jgi:hypothetical protein